MSVRDEDATLLSLYWMQIKFTNFLGGRRRQRRLRDVLNFLLSYDTVHYTLLIFPSELKPYDRKKTLCIHFVDTNRCVHLVRIVFR